MASEETITFTVNGVQRTVRIERGERLLDLLREQLGLTGTKRGCDDASCGACTVLVDGKPVRSCNYSARKVDGCTVRTIESMAERKRLHPIQTALIEAGAVQCGYCIPGIVMELHALFSDDLNASREQIIEALTGHLCRCTGYEALLDGALLAQERLKAMP